MEKRLKRVLIIILVICVMCIIREKVGIGIISVNEQMYTSNIYGYGARDEIITEIQDKLKRWGYYKGSVDGTYGYNTMEAMKRFQKKYGLKADGVANGKTLEKMGIYERRGEKKAIKEEKEEMLLAKLIEKESKNEPYVGQVAIGAVIVNRVKSSIFPNTVREVILEEGEELKIEKVSEEALKAAEDAIRGIDPSNGATYYWRIKEKGAEEREITANIGRYKFGN